MTCRSQRVQVRADIRPFAKLVLCRLAPGAPPLSSGPWELRADHAAPNAPSNACHTRATCPRASRSAMKSKRTTYRSPAVKSSSRPLRQQPARVKHGGSGRCVNAQAWRRRCRWCVPRSMQWQHCRQHCKAIEPLSSSHMPQVLDYTNRALTPRTLGRARRPAAPCRTHGGQGRAGRPCPPLRRPCATSPAQHRQHAGGLRIKRWPRPATKPHGLHLPPRAGTDHHDQLAHGVDTMTKHRSRRFALPRMVAM
jgi:hypothetical protein